MSVETITSLLGKTLTEVDRNGDYSLSFTTSENKLVKMFHAQECCESVEIEDVCGDLQDLVGNPILKAEERTEEGTEGFGEFTYTFYEIATIKGSVTIRWYGTSNGYYSTSVNIEEYELDEDGDIIYGGY